jgi:hypothetical protein
VPQTLLNLSALDHLLSQISEGQFDRFVKEIVGISALTSLIVFSLSVVFSCSYMTEKNRKLRDQFETDASSSSHGANNSKITDGGVSSGEGDGGGIFKGVSIFVDGFTVPSSQVFPFLCGYCLLSISFEFGLNESIIGW